MFHVQKKRGLMEKAKSVVFGIWVRGHLKSMLKNTFSKEINRCS